MLKDLRIVCLSGCEWDFTWQPTQEIMLRLARAGNRVLYVEPTGMRSIRFGDWRRILGRLWKKVAGAKRSNALPPALTVYAPLVLPFPHSALARSVNRRIVLHAIRRWLGREIGPDVALWVYFPSPLNADLVRTAGAGLTVFHIMSSAEAARPYPDILEANEALLKGCDLIFANSRRLWEHARRFNPRAYLFRAGVNLEVFEAGGGADTSKPPELAGLNRPVVGYVGALHEWVDVDLLAQVAKAMPDCQFAMVGPVVRDISALSALPNVRLLGQKPHWEIPRYVRCFDACVIPYVRNAYTETAYPAKLNEYLALGKPVVATPLPELVDYNRENGDVLHLAGDAAAFVEALREAFPKTTKDVLERYRKVAQQNSWATRVEDMSNLIEEFLGRRRA